MFITPQNTPHTEFSGIGSNEINAAPSSLEPASEAADNLKEVNPDSPTTEDSSPDPTQVNTFDANIIHNLDIKDMKDVEESIEETVEPNVTVNNLGELETVSIDINTNKFNLNASGSVEAVNKKVTEKIIDELKDPQQKKEFNDALSNLRESDSIFRFLMEILDILSNDPTLLQRNTIKTMQQQVTNQSQGKFYHSGAQMGIRTTKEANNLYNQIKQEGILGVHVKSEGIHRGLSVFTEKGKYDLDFYGGNNESVGCTQSPFTGSLPECVGGGLTKDKNEAIVKEYLDLSTSVIAEGKSTLTPVLPGQHNCHTLLAKALNKGEISLWPSPLPFLRNFSGVNQVDLNFSA